MHVAVITPYHDPENPWLQECIESVAKQTYTDCSHVLVGDGCDCPMVLPDSRLHKVNISHNIGDYGDSPRSLGAIYAFSRGADAVAFLDSDNWYEPDHIESLVALQTRTNAEVVTSYRKLVRLDGEVMGACPDSDGITFCDTSCMFFVRSASEVATSWWSIPKAYHALDDRVIWDRVMTKCASIACTREASVAYRTAFQHHYTMFGLAPPPGAKIGKDIGRLSKTMAKLQYRAAQMAPQLMKE